MKSKVIYGVIAAIVVALGWFAWSNFGGQASDKTVAPADSTAVDSTEVCGVCADSLAFGADTLCVE